MEKANEFAEGDGRVRVTLQQEDKSGQWISSYVGYAGRYLAENLDAQTQYHYRLRFQNENGTSDWSALSSVSTAKEPLTGIHLHRAVTMNDAMGTERILEIGRSTGDESEVNVEVTDKYGFTPLMQAAQKGFTEIIDILLRYGADVDNRNDAGKTALMLAAFSGQLGAVQSLREHGASYTLHDKGGSTPLHWAVDGQNLDLITFMIDDGADVNIRDSVSSWTPLLRCAAVTGNKDVAKVLIKEGADINAVDVDGKTALMTAVLNGHHLMVEMLLQYDADISVLSASGKTAYEMAIAMEKRKVAKILEDYMTKMGMKIPNL